MWEFSVQADHKLKYGKSDMLIFHKYVGECPKIDAASHATKERKKKYKIKLSDTKN